MNSQTTRNSFCCGAALGLLAVLAVLCGCATSGVAMKLAPELSATAPLPVMVRSTMQLAFGRWYTGLTSHPAASGWQISGTPKFLPGNAEVSVKSERAWLEFQIMASTPESRPVSAVCLAQGRFADLTTFHERSEDETSVTIPGFPRLDCEFSGARAGTLALRAAFATQVDHGEASFGQDRWIVRSVNTHARQHSNLPLTRFGYEIVLGDRVVAAVETYGAGRVWLLPELSRDQQEQVSCLVAALLYYGTLLEQQDA